MQLLQFSIGLKMAVFDLMRYITMFATWKCSALFILFISLQGCTTRHQSSPAGPLDFAWKLSGDRSVAPLQVFSDASHIWLQWRPNQILPAIFGLTDHGEQLASYTRQGPYAKLDGHWGGLVFRGAHRQARARRSHDASMAQEQSLALAQSASPSVTSSVTPEVTSTVTSTVASTTAPIAQALPVKTPSQPFYAITPTDKNLRQALARWSGLSGWRFQAEHWSVDVDIPLTATANFSDDFIGSVRALIEATELSERPLQPCFYANQVLRVVPITEACDRTVTEGASL